MVKDQNGKGMMLCALLDSGCSHTIILKQFTDKKNHHHFAEKEKIKYTIYGSHFTSDSFAAISFKLIKLISYKKFNQLQNPSGQCTTTKKEY